jgi:CheY-like chemotaxis protein
MDANSPILIVEDDENDAFIVNRALLEAGVTCPIEFCENGLQAQAYLCGKEPYSDRSRFPLPWLLLTDLKMQKMDGLELLQWLRGYSGCGYIPTLVFSASRQASDVEAAYRLGANSYLAKPTNFRALVEMMKQVVGYWGISEKPPVKNFV